MNAIIFALFFSIFHPFESKNEWEIILFKKTNCTLCYFVELEFKRTDLIFNGQISKKRPGKGQNKKSSLSFYIIDCNRRQRMCSSYGCFGVPTIILSNKKNKQIYRYNDEKSALCERLTKFIINKTNIQPRNKYYLDIFNDITKEQNEEIFENKIDEIISQSKEKYSTDSTDSSDSTSKIPISSSPENFDDQFNNLILPYEFRHFAEEPEKLISFAKMMYANNDLMHVINSINQLRNTIMHGNIKKSIEEKLSQRIIVLNVIKQIFFENFISKRLKNEKPYHHI